MNDLDWKHWFERWEMMQNCYVPHRPYRFDLMVRLADLPQESGLQVLDLGCGPGSLGLRVLQRYPNARVVAVDSNPVLLTMGQAIAGETADRIQFVQADVRQADWWKPYEETFDLVLSATALRWLSAESLEQLYGRVYRVLKPGGWFMNSDHVVSNDPNIQARFREMLHVNRQTAFHTMNAYDWDSFWQGLGRELDQTNLPALRNETMPWEGPDDGLPKQFHVAALQGCGFEQVEFHWQDLGEVVVSARKIVG